MAVIWGVNFPVIKAYLPFIPPLAFNALRFPLAGITVLLILRHGGPITWPDREDWPRVIVMGILGNLVYQGFFIFGLDATLAGNASILLATTPVWTLALSSYRGHERPGLQVWSGILATLAGMLLVVLGGGLDIGLQGSTLRGDLLMVGAAVTWSTYTVGSRNLIRKYGSLPVTAWTLWIVSLCLLIIGIPSLARTLGTDIPITALLGVAYSGVLAIGVAYILWYQGVHRIGNSRTAAYANLTPIIALLVAWIWLKEVPSPTQVAGAAVVLIGLSLARTGRERVS
jgi:drug/metabolite transporter (DMT)-like permease